MKIYLVTHGERYYGYDPRLTADGIIQIDRVGQDMLPKIPLPPLVIVGTGTRFGDTYAMLTRKMPGIPMKRSLFCGSADGLERDGWIALKNGTIPPTDYIGLVGTPGFDPWEFISNLPANTLLCAGGELMTALGLGNIAQEAQLYELDTEAKTGKNISGLSPNTPNTRDRDAALEELKLKGLFTLSR